MDSKKAEALGSYEINLITPDNGEKFAIELSNATFTNVEGFLHENPDLAVTINRTDLEQIMMGLTTFRASIEDGTAQAEGNIDILAEIAQTLVTFEIGFEILPGTGGPVGQVDLNPYEVADSSIQMSGE
jgi:alkyl sulfatase BDS1-like metallo-beta-lactamase superfamily hydrolase